ncbi:MAG TPA: PEP-CTERM sorting domain-containing protein [Caldilineae bacterium]|nr:PEP-CTERM sorting domain-containing protein [Caldilineae bacterium]
MHRSPGCQRLPTRAWKLALMMLLSLTLAVAFETQAFTSGRYGLVKAPQQQETPPLICFTATPTNTPTPLPTDTPTPTPTPYVPPPTPSTPTPTPTPCPPGGPASLVGFVFYDINGDGRRDRFTEPGIGGVTVYLSNGRSKVSNTPSGFWGFLVRAGTYTVWIDVPEGYQATTATSYTWTLAACEFNDQTAFGLQRPTPTPTYTPTPQDTPTPILICYTATPTPTPTWTPTPTITPTATWTPTPTAILTPTATPMSPTETPTPTNTFTPTSTPGSVPASTPTPTRALPTPTPTYTPSSPFGQPTNTPTPGAATATPTPQPPLPPPEIPEPTTLILLSSGLAAGIAAWRRSRR